MTRTVVLMGLLAVTLAGSAAAAADRRARPAAFTIQALRDCGTNGFALPGSTGCVRLSGTVAVTTTLRTGGTASNSPARTTGLFSTQVRGRLAADIRVPTDLGPVRLYTAIRVADPRALGPAP